MLLPAVAALAFTAAFAQTPDPTLPEDADDEQTMVPEDADDADDADDGQTAPDTGTADTAAPDPAAPQVTTAPAAGALRRAAAPDAPARPQSSRANVLVIPADLGDSSEEALRNGCWVRLYEDRSLAGDAVTLLGPVDVPELRGPFGMQWEDRIRSLEVGPSATVSLFGDERFEGEALQLQPARRVPELLQPFQSIRVAC